MNLYDECILPRLIDLCICGSAGFRLAQLVTEYAKEPRPMGYLYCGCALPR